MGSFGYKNFQNDSGMDFEDKFFGNPWPNTVIYALLAVTRDISNVKHFEFQEYEQYDQCCEALAAARKKPSSDFPKTLQPVIDNLVIGLDISARKRARQAVRNVLQKSELRNLWAEMGADELNKWEAVQQDLLIRLK